MAFFFAFSVFRDFCNSGATVRYGPEAFLTPVLALSILNGKECANALWSPSVHKANSASQIRRHNSTKHKALGGMGRSQCQSLNLGDDFLQKSEERTDLAGIVAPHMKC